MNPHNTDRRSGITGVWVALMGSLMIVFLGLAIDTTYVVRTIDELQTAADSAALAGAAQVKIDIDDARAHAKLLAFNNTAGMTDGVRDEVVLALNTANLAAGDIVTGRWYRWDDEIAGHAAGDFDPSAVVGINALKVVARRTDDLDPDAPKTSLPLLFGSLFGWDTIDLEVDATALVVGSTGSGIVVLCHTCECALEFGGTTALTLGTTDDYDGDHSIQVNSNASGCSPNRAAVCGGGNSLEINAPEINIHASGPETACFNGNPTVPPLNPGSPRVPDPLAGLPEPTIENMEDLGCIGNSGCNNTNTCTGGGEAGYHCSSNDDCSGGGTCGATPTLCVGGDNAGGVCGGSDDCPGGSCLTTILARPGYYPGGFRITNSNLNLVLDSGVYSLDNADGGPQAGMVINGGNFDASSGVMLHIVNDGEFDLSGNGDVVINPISDEGHLYWGVSVFQSRTNYQQAQIIGTDTLILEGTYYFPNNHLDVGGVGLAVGNQLITYTLNLHGTGTYTINYDGRNPAPGYVVFLVE